MKRKYELAEKFIGWTSEDGILKVVGIHGKCTGNVTLFRVECSECVKDPELFPLGYFVSTKSNLVNHKQKPCGCAFNPKWNKEQFQVLARRAAKDRFIVHGFAVEFHGQTTKLNLECLVDGYRWSATTDSIINGNKGCPKCSGNARLTEQEALDKCKVICENEGYEPIGFVGGYKNQKSRFEYKCPKHEKQNVSYDSFINGETRCKGCALYGYSTSKQGSFYVYQWSKESHSFIKFGITNQKISSRVKRQQSMTNYKYKKIWSATFAAGNVPLIIENYIKSSDIITSVISKKLFSDGFTETINTKDLDILEDLILECISKIPIE